MGNGHLRLALQIQPGKFKRRPQIGTQENGRTANTQLFSLDGSWNREQQGRIVLIDIGAVFTQLRLFRLIHTASFSRRLKTKRLSSDSAAA